MTPPATDAARMRAILVLAATVGFVGSAFLTPEFRGYDPSQMPVPVVDPPIQPVGFAFGIWGPIYLWLLAHAVAGLFARSDAPDWDAARWPLILSLGPGAGWLATALIAPLAATVLIWWMLIFALRAMAQAPARDPWLARVPLGLLAGWLTAAACVSTGTVLQGWGLASGPVAAFGMLALATAIAVVTLMRGNVPGAYALAAGWGLFGIAVKAAGTDLVLASAAALCLVGVGAVWWRHKG